MACEIGTRAARRSTSASRTPPASIRSNLRAWLSANNVEHKPFWIVNTIRVTASRATLAEIAKRPDVAEILDDKVIPVPPLMPAAPVVPIQGTEWGLDSVRAPEVWQTFGALGDGIVVANIDTGVQFDHPALVNQYRGSQGDGSFNHNYNWFDPSNVCGNPSLVPCDNNIHGTHTMGTMVGDDGSPGNRIGVAPHAKWIAAKGCETELVLARRRCSRAGQWILAPTDLERPEPAARPAPQHRQQLLGRRRRRPPSTRQIVQSWVAAGIFPAFSNGNSGPSCGTAGLAGRLSGELLGRRLRRQQRHRRASPAEARRRSAASSSRTSPRPASTFAAASRATATPASAAPRWRRRTCRGSVALLWSAAPSLIGDIAATEALLSTDRRRHVRHQLRRHRGEQQRLGRGTARRLRRHQSGPARPDRHAQRHGHGSLGRRAAGGRHHHALRAPPGPRRPT